MAPIRRHKRKVYWMFTEIFRHVRLLLAMLGIEMNTTPLQAVIREAR